MPRSSRHKSSKQSSREARDYSDSEKDSSCKDRKRRDESGSNRALKESASGEKRKLDSKSTENKDLVGSGNVEYIDEYGVSSSKKRKEKVDDDRWTGGDDEREASKTERNLKDSKGVGDSKSRSSKRDDNSELGVDGEEGKRSTSKAEPKHHRTDKKEKNEKETGSEREKKGKDVPRSERLVDGEVRIDIMSSNGSRNVGSVEEHSVKHVAGSTGFSTQEELQNPELEREVERSVRRKKETAGDGDKHQDGVQELADRRLSSRVDSAKPERSKDQIKSDKYREDVDKDSKHQVEKQRDGRHTRDYTYRRSDDKHLRSDKKELDLPQKKSKPQDSDHDRDRSCHKHDRHDHDRERDDRERELEHDVVRDRDREQGHDRGRDIDQDRDRERNHERYRRERDRDRIQDRDRGRKREHDDRDYRAHIDRSSRYKDDRRQRRSPNDYDDRYSGKSKSVKLEGDADIETSLSRKARVDTIISSSRGRTSPISKSHIGLDKYRSGTHDDFKHGDFVREATNISQTHDKSSKYLSMENHAKLDNNHIGNLPTERSPGNKASPKWLVEGSPASTTIDHKYLNRTGRRQSLDVDEAERRSTGSNNVRDGSINEDSKKPFGEEYQGESSFYHRSSQGNASLASGPPGFRGGADGPPFSGSIGEEGRIFSASRYRNVDLNVGRVHGNPWKGVPNWPSPLPNGFMPFPPGPPHGPPHAGFPGMIPQFPSPMFNIRPSMEMNHPGIPYMSDADRFSSHIRPLGWQNMVDGLGPHFHGWDTNNGILRDGSPLYRTGHLSDGRARETNTDLWKPNGDVNFSVASASQKDGPMLKASTEETCAVQDAEGPCLENNHSEGQGKSVAIKVADDSSPSKEDPATQTKAANEKTPESSPYDDAAHSLRVYLSKLDISIELVRPELYNECKNLAIEELSGDEDITEHVPLEECTNAGSEVINPAIGISLFPTVEDSIFQRAMDLYKTQSMKRRSLPGGRQILGPVEEMNKLGYTSGQEIQELPVTVIGPVLSTSEEELKGPISTKDAELLKNLSSGSPGLEIHTLGVEKNTKALAPVVGHENTKEKNCEATEEEDDKGHSSSEEGMPRNSVTDNADVNIVGKKACSEPPVCAEELPGGTVSGPLNLPHGSVNVCEALLSVSNEFESVISTTRIHPDPGSTH
ncbi:hypothetical protein Nepgr_010743 [Nepenthes gracilis]|uniref:Uncharacterized protein n=1 Tax=Nepenthes gracilis TaxID=150966 RepID=A0AAD3SCZ4_NEPGR|nr:hypothetical protein Nepgr_010743 [Nepenthes gracilis]